MRIIFTGKRSAINAGSCCMKRLPFIVLMSVFIVGCQSPSQTRKYWTKLNTTLEQAIEDCKQCTETARGKATEGYYNQYRDSVVDGEAIPFDSTLAESQRDFEELHSFRRCMRSLGYQQVFERQIATDARRTYRLGGGEIQHLAGE